MTERKFTDEEAVAGLRVYVHNKCENCTVKDLGVCCSSCFIACGSQVLDLINRQRANLQEVITLNSKLEAKNAELQRLLDFYEETSGNKKARAEAIKEFAERLKEKMNYLSRMEYHCDPYFLVSKDFIDKTAKELTEGKPCTEGADCSKCENCYHDGGYNECAVDGIKPN